MYFKLIIMPTPNQYDKSRDEIRKNIRETLGMRVPTSANTSLPISKEEIVETKSIDSQILQELQQIKILLKQLVEKIS